MSAGVTGAASRGRATWRRADRGGGGRKWARTRPLPGCSATGRTEAGRESRL